MGIDSGTKGKIAELSVIRELLRNGHSQIYTPVSDVGIDIIVKNADGTYAELQVKSRSKEDAAFTVQNINAHDRLYVVLHVLNTDSFWIIPSVKFLELSKKTAYGYILTSTKENIKKMQQYRNSWDLLSESYNAEENPVKPRRYASTKKRIESPHFKNHEFYPYIIETLKMSNRPLTRKEIVTSVGETLKDRLSQADHEKIKSGIDRWEAACRWAVTALHRERKIVSNGRNQWTLP